MENMDVNPEAKNASGKPSKMKAIFAAVFAVALVFGGVYYFVFGQDQATPPSLGASDSLYQGFIKEAGSLMSPTQLDIDNWDDTVKSEKLVQADYTNRRIGLVPFYSDIAMSFDDVMKSIDPSTIGEIALVAFKTPPASWDISNVDPGALAYYDGKGYILTPEDYYGSDAAIIHTDDATWGDIVFDPFEVGVIITSNKIDIYNDHIFLPGVEAYTSTESYDPCTTAKEGWTLTMLTPDVAKRLEECVPTNVYMMVPEAEMTDLQKGFIYNEVLSLSEITAPTVGWVYYENDPVIVATTPDPDPDPVETLPPYICATTEEDYYDAFAQSVGNLKSYDVYGLLADVDRSLVGEMYAAIQYANDGLAINELAGALEQLSGPLNTIVNNKDLLTLIAVTLEPSIPALIGIDTWYDDYSVNTKLYLSSLTNTIGGVSASVKDMSESGVEIENYLLEVDELLEYLVNDISNWAAVNPAFVVAETNINDTRNVILNELEFNVTDLLNDKRNVKVLAKNDGMIGTDSFLQGDQFLELDVTLITDADGCYRGDFDYLDDAKKQIFVDGLVGATVSEGVKASAVAGFLDALVPIFQAYVSDGLIDHFYDALHEYVILGNGLGFDVTDQQHTLDTVGYQPLNFNPDSQMIGNFNEFGSVQECTDPDGVKDYVLMMDEGVREKIFFAYIDLDSDGDGTGDIIEEIDFSDLLKEEFSNNTDANNAKRIVQTYLFTNTGDATPEFRATCVPLGAERAVAGGNELGCDSGFSLNEAGECKADGSAHTAIINEIDGSIAYAYELRDLLQNVLIDLTEFNNENRFYFEGTLYNDSHQDASLYIAVIEYANSAFDRFSPADGANTDSFTIDGAATAVDSLRNDNTESTLAQLETIKANVDAGLAFIVEDIKFAVEAFVALREAQGEKIKNNAEAIIAAAELANLDAEVSIDLQAMEDLMGLYNDLMGLSNTATLTGVVRSLIIAELGTLDAAAILDAVLAVSANINGMYGSWVSIDSTLTTQY